MTSAYGILVAIQNFGTTIGPFIVTYAHNKTIDNKFGFFAVNWINAA